MKARVRRAALLYLSFRKGGKSLGSGSFSPPPEEMAEASGPALGGGDDFCSYIYYKIM